MTNGFNAALDKWIERTPEDMFGDIEYEDWSEKVICAMPDKYYKVHEDFINNNEDALAVLEALYYNGDNNIELSAELFQNWHYITELVALNKKSNEAMKAFKKGDTK